MKKLPVVLMILLLALGLFICANAEENVPATTRLEGPGYGTPEEAVMAYIDAMNRGDVSGMLSTFAIETLVDRSSPLLYLERIRRFSINTSAVWKSVPLEDDYLRSLATAVRYASVTGNLKAVYTMYATGGVASVRLETPDVRSELTDIFRKSPLNSMTGFVEFIRWLNPAYVSGGNAVKPGFGGNIMEMLAYAGGDDYTELVAMLRINGNLAFQPMQCVKYGDRWYNLEFNTSTAASSNFARESWTQLLWLPLDTVSNDDLLQLADGSDPEAETKWNALQESDWAGTRWPMTSLNMPGVTVHDTAEAAENDSSVGIWAEALFTRTGGAMITIAASPALRRQLGWSDEPIWISFSWFADEIPTTYILKNGKERPLFRLFNGADFKTNLSGITVARQDNAVKFILADGTQAVFEKPAAAPAASQAETVVPLTRLEGSGYSTPEEAVLAYIDAMNRGSVRDMMATFAIETYADHADPLYRAEQIGMYSANTSYYTPFTDSYSRSLLAHDRYGVIASNLLQQYLGTAVDISSILELKTDADIRSFMDQVRQSPMNGLTGNVSFDGWISPVNMSLGAAVSSGRSTMAQNVILAGADDLAILAARVLVNGKTAYLPMRCIRYGDRWYNDYPATEYLYYWKIATTYSAMAFLLIPTEEDQAYVTEELNREYAEENALWESIRQSDLGGTRWTLVSMNIPDITLHDTESAAKNDTGAGIRAEMRFTSAGGGVITVTCSPALQEKQPMTTATARITFAWQPDSAAGSQGLRMDNLFSRNFDQQRPDEFKITAVRTESGITLTFPDGTEATFRKTED